jgi:hypothetical protein
MIVPHWLALQVDFSIFWMRLPDALFGVLFNVLLFLVVRSFSSTPVAILTTLLAATGSQMIQSWRLGVAHGPPLLLPILLIFCVHKVLNGRRWKLAACGCGVILGLSLQVYLPARVLLPVFGAWCLMAFALPQGERNRRQLLASALITGVIAFVSTAPLLKNYLAAPYAVLPRNEYFIFREPTWGNLRQELRADGVLDVLFHQAKMTIGGIFWHPDRTNGDFYLTDYGFFDPLSAALVVFGLIAAIVSRKTPRSVLFAVVGAIIAAGALSFALYQAPRFNRMLPVFSFLWIVAGWGIARLWAIPSGAWRTFITLLIVGQSLWSLHYYFYDLESRHWRYTLVSNLARYLDTVQLENSIVIFLEPGSVPGYVSLYGTFRILIPKARIHEARTDEISDFRGSLNDFQSVLLVSLVEKGFSLPPSIDSLDDRSQWTRGKETRVGPFVAVRFWQKMDENALLPGAEPMNERLSGGSP